MRQQRVFIVGGGGMVGATAAQTLALRGYAREIVLIDIAEELVWGQAMDITYAMAFSDGVTVRTGSYDEIREDDIIVITSGVSLAQRPGKTRLELLDENAGIIRDVVGKVMAQGKPVYLVLVSNPVDVLTQVALEASGLPTERVFGTGTVVDTARLRVTLARSLNVSPQDVQAYILGEHGDSSFAALSAATVGGVALKDMDGFTPDMAESLEQDIRDAAYKIVAAKRSTHFGTGRAIAEVVEALLREIPSILPVCSLTNGEYGLKGIAVGLPSAVSSRGVKILDHYALNAEEKTKLAQSAAIVREALASLVVHR